MGKKKKSKDFQKVKLKVGKQLAKRSNETTTDFKSKKIVLKDIAGDARRSEFDKKLTLLGGSFVTTQMKLAATNRLVELMNGVQERQLNGEFFNCICKNILDEDNRVRQVTIKCIKASVAKLKDKDLSPILQLILTYLNCGLTHINQSVITDSYALLSFVVDKCEESSLEALMKLVMTRVNVRAAHSTLDVSDYELLHKLISKITSRKRMLNNGYLNEDAPQMKWSVTNNFCDINYQGIKPSLHFNISFQSASPSDIEDSFIETIRELINRDLTHLCMRQAEKGQLNMNLKEARKSLAIINIGLMLKSSCIPMRGKAPSIHVKSLNGQLKNVKKIETNLQQQLTSLMANIFEI